MWSKSSSWLGEPERYRAIAPVEASPSQVAEAARMLMVLEVHGVRGRERVIDAYRRVRDNHQFGVVEYIERLRGPEKKRKFQRRRR